MRRRLVRRVPTLLAMTFFCVLGVTSSWASPQIIRGRWEKLQAQSEGTRLIVYLRGSNTRIEGVFVNLDEATLHLLNSSGGDVRIARSDIHHVTNTNRIDDPVNNGVILGMLTGAAIGGIFAALV